jgi:hypothetical protein
VTSKNLVTVFGTLPGYRGIPTDCVAHERYKTT